MTCNVIKGDGVTIIACSRGRGRRDRCAICGATATVLCDYPLRGTKAGKTCSLPLCRQHSVHTDKNLDLCPAHARLEAPKLFP